MLYSGNETHFVDARYDVDSFGGQAVVVRMDGTAIAYRLNENGYIVSDEEEEIRGDRSLRERTQQLKVAYPLGVRSVEK